jgi:hypothetical protein
MSTTEIAQAFSVKVFDEIQIETKKLPVDEMRKLIVEMGGKQMQQSPKTTSALGEFCLK